MGPTVGRYLEDGEAEILKNLDEEWVQRKPHPELKVALGQCHMTDLRNVQPLQISRLDHHNTVLLCYLRTSSRVIEDSRSPQLTAISSSTSSRQPEVDTASCSGSAAPLSTG